MIAREHAAVARALDAIRDGETTFAAELLEDLLRPALRPVGAHRCAICEQPFAWPGARDDHEAIAHGWYREDHEEAVRVAA